MQHWENSETLAGEIKNNLWYKIMDIVKGRIEFINCSEMIIANRLIIVLASIIHQ